MITHTHAEIDRRIAEHRWGALRRSLVDAAKQRRAAAAQRRSKAHGPFYAEVEDVLHAAGCVEVQCLPCRGVPGVVDVRPSGFDGRTLRDDETAEIVAHAERALAGVYRVQVDWDADVPHLRCTAVPVELSLF